MVFTETWLTENIINSEILCDKYIIYRRDRGNNIKGGGILIAVSALLASELLSVGSTLDVEFISVLVKLKYKNILISCSYIPPNSSESTYEKHYEAITDTVRMAHLNDSVITIGDFNIPAISWNFSPDDGYYTPFNSGCNAKFTKFIDCLLDLNLYQINGIYNVNRKLLDLIFVNDCIDISIHRTVPITLPEDCYHPTIELTTSFSHVHLPGSVRNSKLKDFCFKKANYHKLNELLINTNWNNLLSIPISPVIPAAIEDVITKFYDRLHYIINQSVPMQTVSNPTGPPWNTPYLSNIKNKKNKYYKMYKKSGLSIHFVKYSAARADYNKINQNCYNCYIIKMRNNFKTDPRSFYNFVNVKRKSNSFPPVMKLNNCESYDDLEISNMFADFFSSTYTDDEQPDFNQHPRYGLENQSTLIPFMDESSVRNYLRKLKFSYKYGPDKVPSCVLIKCADALTFPLTMLFNLSIKFGFFPEIWKNSYIIPLFKSGSKTEIANYRGIAKLCTIPKLFEKLVCDHLSHHVSSLVSPCQHGFRKGYSTITNLLEFTSLVNRGFLNKKQTDVVYTDFSKAFDKVNHLLLIKKLHLMGFSRNSLNWIQSYLTNRKQNVIFKNVISKSILVKSGVPQGSHLGPLLFSLFINDLPNVIKYSSILMYADDVKIFYSYNNYNDHKFLQEDLNSLYSWCNVNLMKLNFKKCKYMCFFRRSHYNVGYYLGCCELDNVLTFTDLGILMDPKLNFIQHITLTVSKARSMLGFIKRWAKEFDDPYITKQLFTSLVRPILEYGSIIWDPSYKVHNTAIESVQKQFLLFCLRRFQWNPLSLPSYSSRLSLIKLPSLTSRRTMLNVLFVLNIINGNIGSYFLIENLSFHVPQRPTRYYYPLAVKAFRTNYANSDPFIRCCRDFNRLYSYVDFSVNNNVIKRNILYFLNN